MKKNFSTINLITIALVTLVLSSCVPSAKNSLRSRDTSGVVSGNTKVGIGQGKVLSDNPIILSKNVNLSDSYDLNRLVSTVNITNEAFLKGNTSCSGLDYCFEVRENKDSVSPLQTTSGKWGFDVNSAEFLQVNTFYHMSKITDSFYSNLSKSFSRAFDLFSFPIAPTYDTALPPDLMPTANVFLGSATPLVAYSSCDVADNAYFERSSNTLCFGYISGHNARWAQDSSVIYHEAGHFFQKQQLNFRNYGIPEKVDMGNGDYDEAGSIGEGLSDFYSYFINGRTHFAEWGAGRFLSSSRPITEADTLHVTGISSDPDQRLSYPQYIGYDPNRPGIPVEDIHFSGMIISHYLVALTEDIQSKCSMTKRDASDLVVHLINETLAELGDLTAKATEKNLTGRSKVNLNAALSAEWFSKVNPINFRSFSQTMAKNLLNNLGDSTLNRCAGGIYSTDQIEALIDQYGLLLFRTYNENRNLSVPGSVNNTPVNAVNRKKTVLISKNLLILDPSTNASSAYVIDNRTQIKDGVTALQASGQIKSLSSQTPSDLGFNNNNGKVSPGEVVALAVNLYNNSNSTMGGVQVLANDWDHADSTGKPCQFPATMSNDQWPLTSEGGIAAVTTPTPNPCATITETDYAPICYFQSNEANATKWVSQVDFKTKMALDGSSCLDPGNEKECFIRAIKGADQAYFSKINPKSTWGQTLADPATGTAPKLDFGNVILFEVSKHIPPGTIVDCRLRLRFTNCDDCYHDSTRSNYDYTDTDYNGPRPYKIIHLQIPITD